MLSYLSRKKKKPPHRHIFHESSKNLEHMLLNYKMQDFTLEDSKLQCPSFWVPQIQGRNLSYKLTEKIIHSVISGNRGTTKENHLKEQGRLKRKYQVTVRREENKGMKDNRLLLNTQYAPCTMHHARVSHIVLLIQRDRTNMS